MKIRLVIYLLIACFTSTSQAQTAGGVLLDDDFSRLRPGMFSAGVVGAHMEYHYLPASLGQGNWQVSCFKSDASQRAWRVIREHGNAMMAAMFPPYTKATYTHPMVVAGDPLWRDYTVRVRFAPDAGDLQSGLMFRYRNDRCYYFFGVQGSKAVLKMVQHAKAYHKPYEKVLAEAAYGWKPDAFIEATVKVEGTRITASFEGGPVLAAEDDTPFPTSWATLCISVIFAVQAVTVIL